jgi:hypothetical protein
MYQALGTRIGDRVRFLLQIGESFIRGLARCRRLARQNVAGSGRVRNRRPSPAMLRRQAEPPPQPCVWPWRPSRAARRAPLDLPTRAARRGKHAARRCRGLEALRWCLEPREHYRRVLLHNGGLQRCERRWNEVIPALVGTPLLEGPKRGRNPASVLRWTFRNRPSKPRRFQRSRQCHEPQSSRTRLPGSAHRAADVIMDSGRLSGKPPCGPSLRARGTPSLQPRPWLIRPARPSKRASVAVWGASGARRPLRTPRRPASDSSSARALGGARKPPAHRSSGVP